jgi:hypothetical protein
MNGKSSTRIPPSSEELPPDESSSMESCAKCAQECRSNILGRTPLPVFLSDKTEWNRVDTPLAERMQEAFFDLFPKIALSVHYFLF